MDCSGEDFPYETDEIKINSKSITKSYAFGGRLMKLINF